MSSAAKWPVTTMLHSWSVIHTRVLWSTAPALAEPNMRAYNVLSRREYEKKVSTTAHIVHMYILVSMPQCDIAIYKSVDLSCLKII